MNELAVKEIDGSVDQHAGESEDTLTLKRIWRNRRNIKAFQTQASFFRYLFFEYKRIRYFGNTTHIFFPKIIPPGLQLSKDVCVTFTKYLQPWCIELLGVISNFLNMRWPHLTKKEYNLMVILKKLCEKIVETDFSRLDYIDRNLIDKLRSLETFFLVLHYRQGYPDIILSVLQRELKKDLNYKKDVKDVILHVKRIINRDDELPSLYNFLIGLNMLKFRRFFNLQDLIHSNSGEMVSSTIHECEMKTQKEIDIYIEDLRRELIDLHKKKLEIFGIRSYLPINELKEIDFRTLEYLYESSEPKKKNNFSKDQENIVLIAMRLFRTFVGSFENILNGKINISGVGYVELFAKNFFHMELTKIKYLTEKLEKLSYHFQSPFSYDQYLLHMSPQKIIPKLDVEAIQLIGEGLTILNDIGKKLERVLRLRGPAEKGEKDPAPLDITVLNGKSFSLPYEDKIIKFKTKLGGKTIAEALSFIVSVSYLMSIFFRKPEIYGLISQEEKVKSEIRSKLDIIERVAKPKIYQELRDTYLG